MPGKPWKDGPEAWQEHFVQLLQCRYKHTQLQVVPDTYGGDYGIEAFARDGSAYQCYAANEPISGPDLYKKQRGKITSDIRKLQRHSKGLAGILGPTILNRWVFAVPRWDNKELLKHAEAKAVEVRSWALQYIAPDFCIHIVTEDDFAVEREQLVVAGVSSLRVEPDQPEQSAFIQFEESHDEWMRNLDTKVNKLTRSLPGTDALALRRQFMLHYLEGQNVLAKLHSEYPDLYEAARRTKTDRERSLATECMLSTLEPTGALQKHLVEFREALRTQFRSLDPGTCDLLVWEAVSDWLLRCPLNFQ